jgi:hypothetical protein
MLIGRFPGVSLLHRPPAETIRHTRVESSETLEIGLSGGTGQCPHSISHIYDCSKNIIEYGSDLCV